jgi:methylmalonyl-CoA mutase cobalamin-binding domain/chain
MSTRKIRVLLTKPTHDCHDRGVRFLARTLRDAGFEVVFTNFLLPQEIVDTALQEDVDVIGLSSSSGGHLPAFEDLMRQLSEREASDILVIGGGVIPEADEPILAAYGVKKVFGPGSSTEAVVEFIRGQLS